MLALQARHGWRKYIVCFVDNPKPLDAQRYADAGLVWCTKKTLRQLLAAIELGSYGIPVASFVLTTTKYTYRVEFDNATASTTDYREQFLGAVEADKAAMALYAENPF